MDSTSNHVFLSSFDMSLLDLVLYQETTGIHYWYLAAKVASPWEFRRWKTPQSNWVFLFLLLYLFLFSPLVRCHFKNKPTKECYYAEGMSAGYNRLLNEVVWQTFRQAIIWIICHWLCVCMCVCLWKGPSVKQDEGRPWWRDVALAWGLAPLWG